MGVFSSKDFGETHILHYTKFYDNKLYVYFPGRNKIISFDIFNNGQKFRFYAQESISTNTGAIFLVGGQVGTNDEDPSNLQLGSGTLSTSLKMTNFVAKINLNKHDNFEVHLEKMKPCPTLPEARSSHLLIYAKPYIFVFGGYLENNIPAKTNLKFDIKKRTWSPISNIGFISHLEEPCGLSYNNETIYIFETSTKTNLPRIFKYSIEMDTWQEAIIQHKSKHISIPSSIFCSAYQITDKDLMILGGTAGREGGPKETKGFYYIFDTHTEEIRDFKYENVLDNWKKERQGDVNYSGMKYVYARLGERNVKVFKKSTRRWETLDLGYEEVRHYPVSCCSKREKF